MRWERMYLNAKLRETADGKKSPGRKGGIFGPGKRWGHTCNSVKGGKFLYVFGGYGKDNCQTNDVYVFDTSRQTWSKPMVKGNPPSPRDSHTCTTVGNNLFVFGGTDGIEPLKDLHIFDTSSNTWISPSLGGEGPDAREGHSAALIGKHLFIFGGCGKSPDNSNEVYYNDLYILDTETVVWRHAMTSGKQPSARDSHTCSSWKNKLIVVAGEDESDYYLSDVHILDTDTLVWKQLPTSGQKLPPRAGHSSVALGKDLFVFGGFTDERNLFDDLHMLNLDLVMENEPDEPRQEKLSLRKELKRKCQEQLSPASLPANGKDVRNRVTVPDLREVPLLPSYGQSVLVTACNNFIPTEYSVARKSTAEGAGADKLNDYCKSESEIAADTQQEVVEHRRKNGNHVECTSQESPMEPTPASTSASNSSAPVDVSLPNMVSQVLSVSILPS
ncbi:hypothetical protein IFM89_011721 [Coptis chinensis]|uniref:Uncharacterized protein n=1 Tax=Coptis chinensis TaxID=261450 RepID=A0A835MCG2_9MAGN|nr:hypothetical protein IFM89_011721 [Coptis chinensis]